MKASISAKEKEAEKKVSEAKKAADAKVLEAKKAAQTEAEHIKRRNDAGMADLRATISSLEASLQKVL